MKINYNFGFYTKLKKKYFPTGITSNILYIISKKNNENKFLIQFRTKAYDIWKKLSFPQWSQINKEFVINYNKLLFYSFSNLSLSILAFPF